MVGAMHIPTYNIVQISNSDPHAVEVLKTFPTRDEAQRAAEKAQQEDRTNYFEYLVIASPDTPDEVESAAEV